VKPCKHLNHDVARNEATIETAAPHYPDVRYWVHDGRKVQYCKLRGRIKGVFQCWQQGEMSCYDPSEEVKT